MVEISECGRPTKRVRVDDEVDDVDDVDTDELTEAEKEGERARLLELARCDERERVRRDTLDRCQEASRAVLLYEQGREDLKTAMLHPIRWAAVTPRNNGVEYQRDNCGVTWHQSEIPDYIFLMVSPHVDKPQPATIRIRQLWMMLDCRSALLIDNGQLMSTDFGLSFHRMGTRACDDLLNVGVINTTQYTTIDGAMNNAGRTCDFSKKVFTSGTVVALSIRASEPASRRLSEQESRRRYLESQGLKGEWKIPCGFEVSITLDDCNGNVYKDYTCYTVIRSHDIHAVRVEADGSHYNHNLDANLSPYYDFGNYKGGKPNEPVKFANLVIAP